MTLRHIIDAVSRQEDNQTAFGDRPGAKFAPIDHVSGSHTHRSGGDEVLVLHIGRHKCGSSSIQHFMSSNVQRLDELGVVYPRIGRKRNAHHEFARQMQDGASEALDAILAMERRQPDKMIVISSEKLCLSSPRQIAKLKHDIGATQTQIVMYIRPISAWLPSKYNEFTRKGSNLVDFDKFYAMHPIEEGLHIVDRAHQWAQVFGWQNLRIRSLDPRSLSGTLIEDFISIFGLSLSDLRGEKAWGLEAMNVSLGWKALELLRAQFASVEPYHDCYEIRQNRTKISLQVAACVRNAVAQVSEDLGIGSERTQYISACQWSECDTVYRENIDWLNTRVVGPPLPRPDLQLITERPFLPTLARIPIGERLEVKRRLETLFQQEGKLSSRFFARLSPGGRIGKELRRAMIDSVVTAR